MFSQASPQLLIISFDTFPEFFTIEKNNNFCTISSLSSEKNENLQNLKGILSKAGRK